MDEKDAFQQIRLRSRGNHIVRVAFDMQRARGWSDELTVFQLAISLIDQNEHLQKLVLDTINQLPPRNMVVDGKEYVYTGPPWEPMDATNR